MKQSWWAELPSYYKRVFLKFWSKVNSDNNYSHFRLTAKLSWHIWICVVIPASSIQFCHLHCLLLWVAHTVLWPAHGGGEQRSGATLFLWAPVLILVQIVLYSFLLSGHFALHRTATLPMLLPIPWGAHSLHTELLSAFGSGQEYLDLDVQGKTSLLSAFLLKDAILQFLLQCCSSILLSIFHKALDFFP